MKKLFVGFLILVMTLLCVVSCGETGHTHEYDENGECSCGEKDPDYAAPHEHNFVDGKCECGEEDPNYEPPHEHNFVDGKCECGEEDPNYEPPHEHNFVDGKCACGEEDPNYEPPHEHNFVDGKCECGETDPNYKPDDPATPPAEKKSIKILFFGNSYSVDATKWLSKIFLEAGYDDVIVGNVATGGCCINEHWSFLDGIEGNEPNDGDFFYTKFVNGKEVAAEDDYAFAIADEDWDIISLQHAPDELKQIDTYSHLQDFLDYILARTTNPDVKLVFHMIWAHNNVADIKSLYNSILEITDRYVTVKTEFDGLVPSATMIEYLRDAGLTNATYTDDVWTAGDITRDWGHMNYGLGRYALGLLYYAYLTGESIDDFTWVPTPDMVAGTSEAQGFAEITSEKLAIIKAAIKYALANPYGEDYEPKNGDGIGFPDCEMGGGDVGSTPLTPDENGYISFEDMSAEGSVLAIPTVDGSLRVTEKDGSDMLEFIYSSVSTEQFKLLPTLSESGADIMIFEADIIDSFGKPRTFKIMAGKRLVYDFRINGSGGFAAEGNNSWWGGNHYAANTKYNLKITVEVTDGKVDLNLYINGEKVARPTGGTGYGANLDLTAEANLVELITHIDITDGSAKDTGSVYIDNYRFVKLAGDDTPAEPPHEHNFVEGKCECGETDPNYKPDTPVEPDTPLIDKDGFVSFEGIDAIPAEIATAQTGTINVKANGGSNALEFVYEKSKSEAFTLYPTKSDDGATKLIIEADVTDSYGSPRFFRIYAGTTVVYDFRINGSGGFAAEGNSVWWGGGHYKVGETYNLKIEATVTDGKLDLNLYINGNLVTRPTAYGSKVDLSAANISEITKITITDNEQAGTVDLGSVFIDNYRFVKFSESTDDPAEPPHEHNFVEGKCECGETDPSYKPEEPDTPVEPEIPTSDYGTPLTFEGIDTINTGIIKGATADQAALVTHNGSKVFAYTCTSSTNDEFFVYKTEASDENGDTYVFEADITADLMSGEDIGAYNVSLRGPSSSKLYTLTINAKGGAYDSTGSYTGNFTPVKEAYKLRIEYGCVEVDGTDYVQVRVYVNGELKLTSKNIEKTDVNRPQDVKMTQVLEGNKPVEGTIYIDNIVSRIVKLSAE